MEENTNGQGQNVASSNTVAIEMPKYECHKTVHALKIASVVLDEASEGHDADGSATLAFENTAYAPITVDSDYVSKHSPVEGGYYVVYEDGYKSFSPAEAFESGYTLIA